MKNGTISRVAASLAIVAAIVGGMAGGIATSTNDTDAALKWREGVGVAKDKDNNKDGLKHTDPVPAP